MFLSERVVPHKLFTPLLIGMVATGIFLSLILMVLLYKYMQVREVVAHTSQYHYYNEEILDMSKSTPINLL